MGIQGFLSLIKANGHEPYQSVNPIDNNLNNYNGTRLAIEVSNLMYKFVYIAGEDCKEKFIEQHEKLKQNGIYVIYVFDGPPMKEKGAVLKKRHEEKLKQIEKGTSMVYPKSEDYSDLRHIFHEKGIIKNFFMKNNFIKILLKNIFLYKI